MHHSSHARVTSQVGQMSPAAAGEIPAEGRVHTVAYSARGLCLVHATLDLNAKLQYNGGLLQGSATSSAVAQRSSKVILRALAPR